MRSQDANMNDGYEFRKKLNNKMSDRDGREFKKIRGGFDIPKHRFQAGDNVDSGCPSSSSSCDRTEPRSVGRDRFILRDTEPSSHQSNRGPISRWKESNKFEGRMHESRLNDRSASRNRNTQGNSSGFGNRFDRNDRSSRDRNRNNFRNTPGSLSLPETFYSLPPRLQRAQLANKGLTAEQIEKFQEDFNNQLNVNCDSRYSQSLSNTATRKSNFNDNRNKHQKYPNPQEKYESKASEVVHEREKSRSNPVPIRVVQPIQDHVQEEQQPQPHDKDTSGSGDASCVDNDSSSDNDSFDDNFDWAAEVEREIENEKRSNSESNGFKKPIDNRKLEEEKKASRKCRKIRSQSCESESLPRSRNVSESESRTSSIADSDGYLSWRRQKTISPSRTGFGTRVRGQQQENRIDNRKSGYSYKTENQSNDIRSNELPTVQRPKNTTRGPLQQQFPGRSREPIIVFNQSTSSNVPPPLPLFNQPLPEQSNAPVFINPGMPMLYPLIYMNEQYMKSRPAWYDTRSEGFRCSRNAPLLLNISRADLELQSLLMGSPLITVWDRITYLRNFLMDALRTLLSSDLEFCEKEDVEQHMWNIQFQNIITLLKQHINDDGNNIQDYKSRLLTVIECGKIYFHSLIDMLEHVYQIRIEEHLRSTTVKPSNKGFEKLPLMSAQKLFLFLGDLAKHKEDIEKTCNYDNARQWYLKANHLNYWNGKPYFHLALLAQAEGSFFDSVYFYMRSLAAFSPISNARDRLLDLFGKSQEQDTINQNGATNKNKLTNGNVIKVETWIRPDGSSTRRKCDTLTDTDNDRSEPTKIYKQFTLSFLRMHGKHFSSTGLETFSEAAMEMLENFKLLLSFSPLPVSTTYLIQLLALNMFAIDTVHVNDAHLEKLYSGLPESMIVISLQMFNLIINRCNQLLKSQLLEMKNPRNNVANYPYIVDSDVQILLPAIKWWCDWLLYHDKKWNPPRSCQKFRISGCGDCWSSLATLINILEEFDFGAVLQRNGLPENIIWTGEEKPDFVTIDLEEDITSNGFGPLMYSPQLISYTYKNVPMNLARVCLRIQKILFFGTIILCGIDPPVLKLQKRDSNKSEYISIVQDDASHENHGKENAKNFDREGIRQISDKYSKIKKASWNESASSCDIEIIVKPHFIILDVDCLIHRMPELRKIAAAVSSTSQKPLYSIIIPSIVLNELERIVKNVQETEDISGNAKSALEFVRGLNPLSNIKCINDEGTIIPCIQCSNLKTYGDINTFHDRIISACSNLCHQNSRNVNSSDQPNKISREVVLLTENRNLKMKAEFSNIPVETICNFIGWAEL